MLLEEFPVGIDGLSVIVDILAVVPFPCQTIPDHPGGIFFHFPVLLFREKFPVRKICNIVHSAGREILIDVVKNGSLRFIIHQSGRIGS